MTRYELRVDGKVVDTPPKELELLFYLASNPNRVYTRDQLLDEVWGFEYYGDSRTIDVHIKRLREKLEGVSDKWSLKTVWGVGYKSSPKRTNKPPWNSRKAKRYRKNRRKSCTATMLRRFCFSFSLPLSLRSP
mgnify:CR=1 FL=1